MTYPPSPNTYWHGDKPLPPRKGEAARAARLRRWDVPRSGEDDTTRGSITRLDDRTREMLTNPTSIPSKRQMSDFGLVDVERC
jgi:hypothetical protein